MIYVKILDPVKAKIWCDGDSLSETKAIFELSSYMEWHVKNYRFMPKYKMGLWSGKVSFYSPNKTLPVGLVPLALRYLATKEDIQIDYDDPYNFYSNYEYDVDKDMFAEHGIELFPDQVFALKALLKHKRGIGVLATAYGKTIVLGAAMHTLFKNDSAVKKILVIVPDIGLIKQTSVDIRELGFPVGVFYGVEKSVKEPIIVATYQSLIKNPEMMEDFDAIFIDEAHGSGDTSDKVGDKAIQKLMNGAVNAFYRYGLTGTMPKEKATYNSIRGILGDVLIQIDAHEMQKIGRLTNCKVIVNSLHYSDKFRKDFYHAVKNDAKVLLATNEKTKNLAVRNAKLKLLSECEERLNHIAHLADNGKVTVVIVNSIKEGKALRDKIEGSVFIDKDTPADDCVQIFKLMREGKIKTLIGTYQKVSTGLNIPILEYVIFASPSRSFIKIIQSIGRSLRKHKDKNMAYIIDVYDRLKGFDSSASERRRFYEEAKYPVVEADTNIT